MEEELAKSLSFRQADNSNTNISSQAASQSLAAQATPRSSIFAGNDAKRMSFDGNMPQYNIPSSLGLTSGLLGGIPSYNRDRRDSLKNLMHLEDFATPTD